MKTPNIFESPNVAFFGTMCTLGSGTGVVIRTGDDTVIGRIANLSMSAVAKPTPLSLEMGRFVHMIGGIAICLGVIFFIFGLFYYTIITNVLFAIGIIVANVPEGLIATVSISLALTAKRLAKKMVLVKNLESVETLGSTTCICSDKTGTLTQNRMTVSQLFFDRNIVDATLNWQTYQDALLRQSKRTEEGGKKVVAPKYDFTDPSFINLVKTVALSTTAFFAYNPGNDVIRARYAKKHKMNVDNVPKDPEEENMIAEFKELKKELIEIENSKPYFKQTVEGDASETGLVKFIEPLLTKKYGGQYELGLQGIREAYPIIKYGKD